jgi:hypothetical protein
MQRAANAQDWVQIDWVKVYEKMRLHRHVLCFVKVMNLSSILFILVAIISGLLLTAIMAGEGELKLPHPKQLGDSSLGRTSVNWLGAIALLCAILICVI